MELQSKLVIKHTATMPKEPDQDDPAVVLTYADLDSISRMLRKNLSNKEALLQAISSMVSINVEGVLVPLDPRLLSRLKSRCLDKPNWTRWLVEVVTKQLPDYAGF